MKIYKPFIFQYILIPSLLLISACDKKGNETCGEQKVTVISFDNGEQFKTLLTPITIGTAELKTDYLPDYVSGDASFHSYLTVHNICNTDEVDIRWYVRTLNDSKFAFSSYYTLDGIQTIVNLSYSNGANSTGRYVTMDGHSDIECRSEIAFHSLGSWAKDSAFLFTYLQTSHITIAYLLKL
jgi:hypothetical protein